jgi:N-acyl amino acid synthase of PEP-CTERM/exosortase system
MGSQVNVSGSDKDLVLWFDKYFELILANTEDKLQEVFRLRYQVYCLEARVPGFNPSDYPAALESDLYDRHSVHCLLRHRPTNAVAGTTRLILTNPANPTFPLPIEMSAAEYLENSNIGSIPRDAIGEISRFILASRFRCRQGEQQWLDGVSDTLPGAQAESDPRRIAHPITGLMKAICSMSWDHQIQYLFMAMDDRLNRLLLRLGLRFQAVTQPIQHYGTVKAYLTFIPQAMAELYHRNRAFWTLLSDNGRVWPLDPSRVSTQKDTFENNQVYGRPYDL